MYQIQFLLNSSYYTIPHIYASLMEAEEDLKYLKPGYKKRIVNVPTVSSSDDAYTAVTSV